MACGVLPVALFKGELHIWQCHALMNDNICIICNQHIHPVGWKLPCLLMVLYGGTFDDTLMWCISVSGGDQRDQCVCGESGPLEAPAVSGSCNNCYTMYRNTMCKPHCATMEYGWWWEGLCKVKKVKKVKKKLDDEAVLHTRHGSLLRLSSFHKAASKSGS